MRITVKVLLDDDDPLDAAIIEALGSCLPRRRAGRLRALAAAGLERLAEAPEPRARGRPSKKALPQPRQPDLRIVEEEQPTGDALTRATDNFTRAFG